MNFICLFTLGLGDTISWAEYLVCRGVDEIVLVITERSLLEVVGTSTFSMLGAFAIFMI